MSLEKQIKRNQQTISDLAASIGIWITTPQAQSSSVRAKIAELYERLQHRLQELEVQGQTAKIEIMSEVVQTIKDAAEVPAL